VIKEITNSDEDVKSGELLEHASEIKGTNSINPTPFIKNKKP
jgi:hypothetical protein